MSLKTFLGATAVLAAFTAVAAHAESVEVKRAFDIPGQPLDGALLAYSRQSDIQVIANAERLTGRRSVSVKGQLSPRQALTTLLSSSGLSFSFGVGTVTIAPPATKALAAPTPRSLPIQLVPRAPDAVITPRQLEEIVVTATGQSDIADRIPLSIAAVSQSAIDRQGLREATELARTVPGLNVTSFNVGLATFSIRGVVSNTGAATTGVYINDTSLTKRSNGGNFQNNGAPLPQLFDLERVEVLKGPQGTLYGGSSQGGTIRFITRAPSVFLYSGQLQVEGSKLAQGETGHMVGIALGGPIFEGKLGFRVSAFSRRIAGFVDTYDPYSGRLLRPNANTQTDQAARFALLWRPSAKASVELTHFRSRTVFEGGPNAPTRPLPAGQTFTTPQTCNSTIRTVPLLNAAGQPQGTVPTTVPCPGVPTANVYVRPASTYGPFDYLGRDDAILATALVSRQQPSGFDVSTLTFDYDLGSVKVRSITSYTHDKVKSATPGVDEPALRQTTEGGLGGFGAGVLGFPLFALKPDYALTAFGRNRRYGLQQEVRFSTPPTQRPFSWVGGVYYSDQRAHTGFTFAGSSERTINQMYGVTALQRYGIDNVCDGYPCGAVQDASFTDRELAVFGEGAFWLNEKLSLIAGARLSKVTFKYRQLAFGQFTARLPTDPNATTIGRISDSPISPKLGLQYDFAENRTAYLTVAKGFRAGGVNPQLSGNQCAAGLDVLGITANQVPRSYGPDTVWSYELGAKLRLFGDKAQLNLATYRIDWKNVQSTINVPGCGGQGFVMNGPRARSQGLDLQSQFRPLQSLRMTMSASYVDAYYVDQVAGPAAARSSPSFNAGDKIAVPTWQVAASAEQYLAVSKDVTAFWELNYQWQAAYFSGPSPGATGFNPYTRRVPPRDAVSLRAGVIFRAATINIFINNPLGDRDRIGNAGNGAMVCAASSVNCSSFSFFNPFVGQAYERPREFGLQTKLNF